MKEKIENLAKRNREAKTPEEKEIVANEMNKLRGQNPQEFIETLEELINDTASEIKELTISERLGDVSKMVSMAYIAKNYFGKSRSWLAHKLNGNIVNGKPSSFTDSELSTFKQALADMSDKILSLSRGL